VEPSHQLHQFNHKEILEGDVVNDVVNFQIIKVLFAKKLGKKEMLIV